MIGKVVQQIKGMLEKINPAYIFECDEARMINVKIDTVPRFIGVDDKQVSNSFIYLEEPTYGSYLMPYRGFNRQQTFLRIYFCKFEEMHNDAYKGDTDWSENSGRAMKRIEIRDQIEEEMVRPFLYLLRFSELGMRYPTMLTTLRTVYPRPRFDANEVSVGLEIMFEEDVCLKDYRP